ncbi:MAG: hypothetical protein VYA34_16095 [Myxococcota bacterium]|nr:hypothetical protein [Myxococcota bacterium]
MFHSRPTSAYDFPKYGESTALAKEAPETQDIPCDEGAINDFICEYLPIKPTQMAGRQDSNLGTFPQPPADLVFQPLATTLSFR